MSSTNRGSNRGGGADDFFATPLWAVRRLLEACPLPAGAWLEPGAGSGNIIRAVNARRSDVRWTAIEKRPEEERHLRGLPNVERVVIADYLSIRTSRRFDVAITNPPFVLAQEFIEKSLTLAVHVVMLLRLNFLASGKRAEFMRAHPPDVYVLPNRPSFTPNGRTDSIEYAWMHWRSDTLRPAGELVVLEPTDVEARKT